MYLHWFVTCKENKRIYDVGRYEVEKYKAYVVQKSRFLHTATRVPNNPI